MSPFEGEDVGVVDDAVDHGCCDDLVSEDAAPAGEGQVAGEHQAGVFVAGADELEEQVRSVLFEGQVADLVDDDESVAAQLGQFGGEPSGAVGVGQAGDPVGGGGEQDPVSVAAGGHAEGDRQMGLSGAGWSEEDNIAGFGEEPAGGQGRDLVADGCWASKSKSSRVLRVPNPADRIRISAPEALRADTSRSRTAAR